MNITSIKMKACFVLIVIFIYSSLHAQNIAIIPEPVKINYKQGDFVLTQNTTFKLSDPSLYPVQEYLLNKLATRYGISLAANGHTFIEYKLTTTNDPQIGAEGYTLDVTAQGIIMTANTSSGLFYATQTLLQLLPLNAQTKELRIPAVSILDYPRFAYRGVMLDVSRHFFSKEYIKNYIDQIAQYKFNRFHWHLTDDNGWRVEIKSYPKLTEVGAWRVPRIGTFNTNDPPKPGEKATDGGFYTQEEIREVVQYAKDRFIEILPEIDVPGHSMAALAAYPELSVTKDTTVKVNPGTAFSTWHGNGKFTMHIDNTLNPTDENVYQFLDKVFTELAQLFPYEYIHIGGDECYKGYWERDPKVQAFMKKNKIQNAEALQGYFTKRVAEIVLRNNKKVIGWDEILESPLPPNVDVMSWRGVKGGIEAAHQKRKVVMSPNPVYYLDMRQGDPKIEPPIYDQARLSDVYNHEVIPTGVDSLYILGGQGNLWTEQVPTVSQVEYMTYPRAFALAESFWSPKPNKNWDRFIDKVQEHFIRLDRENINYSPALYDPVITVTKNSDKQMMITLSKEVKDLTLHYTFDNTVPNKYSPAYNEPLIVPDGADNFRVISYRNGKPLGRLISLTTEELGKRIKKSK